MLSGSSMKEGCGPCLSEKEIKKRKERDAKELKDTINVLVKHGMYDEKTMHVVGALTSRLIQLTGPLK